jgi:hypothetical protein
MNHILKVMGLLRVYDSVVFREYVHRYICNWTATHNNYDILGSLAPQSDALFHVFKQMTLWIVIRD